MLFHRENQTNFWPKRIANRSDTLTSTVSGIMNNAEIDQFEVPAEGHTLAP